MTGMMGVSAEAPIPQSPAAQTAQSLSDLLAVLADPAKATAMLAKITAEIAQHEASRLAAQDAIAAARVRHAQADEREKALDLRHAEQEKTARQLLTTAGELTGRESGVVGLEERAKQKTREADEHHAHIHGALREREGAVTNREAAVLRREGAVKAREDEAAQLIAQYTSKLDSFRRIAVG